MVAGAVTGMVAGVLLILLLVWLLIRRKDKKRYEEEERPNEIRSVPPTSPLPLGLSWGQFHSDQQHSGPFSLTQESV